MVLFALIGLRGPTAVHVKFLFYYKLRLQPATRKTVTFKEILARNIPIYQYTVYMLKFHFYLFYTTIWETSIKKLTSIERSVGSLPKVTA